MAKLDEKRFIHVKVGESLTDEPPHVGGQRSGDGHALSVGATEKGENAGVKGVPTDVWVGRAVEIVAHKGTANASEMDSKLVGASRERGGTYKGIFPVEGKDAVACPCEVAALPFTAVFTKDHALGGSAHICIDGPILLLWDTLENGKIELADLSFLHGTELSCRRHTVAGNEQQTAGVSIQSVYGAEDKGYARGAVTKGEGVCHRVPMMVAGGMGGHIRGLVGNGQVLILVDHRQGKVYGL